MTFSVLATTTTASTVAGGPAAGAALGVFCACPELHATASVETAVIVAASRR
jgi:hypothetical protein